MKRPAYQHYPGDWHACVELQGCSLPARGLWIEMCGLMHLGDPYGTLTVKGKDMTRKDTLIGYLAGWTGIERKDIETAFAELEAAEVFSYTPEGIVYSRRMVRDEQVRQARANGGVESLKNPNVPKRKDTHQGSPLVPKVKVVQSVEDEEEDEVKGLRTSNQEPAEADREEITRKIAKLHPELSHLHSHELPLNVVQEVMECIQTDGAEMVEKGVRLLADEMARKTKDEKKYCEDWQKKAYPYFKGRKYRPEVKIVKDTLSGNERCDCLDAGIDFEGKKPADIRVELQKRKARQA